MPDLTARLLDPETFGQATEACLSDPYQAHLCIGFFAEAVAELHARLRTAKDEGAAEVYEELARNLPNAPSLFMRRAAAIRKGIEAKEGK